MHYRECRRLRSRNRCYNRHVESDQQEAVSLPLAYKCSTRTKEDLHLRRKPFLSLLFCITPVVGIQLAIFYFTLTARGAVFHKSPLEIKSPSYPQLLFLSPTTATNIRTRNNVHTGLQPSILKDLDRLQKILLATVISRVRHFELQFPPSLRTTSTIAINSTISVIDCLC